MGNRAHTESARLRRLKRVGHKLGMTIRTTNKLDPKIVDGGYMLSLDDGFKVLLGDKPLPFSASLDQIEAYFDTQTSEDENA